MVKKKVAGMEASKNLDLDPHSRPSTSSSRRKRRKARYLPAPATAAGSSSDSDPSPQSSSPRSVRHLLETYSKPRLLTILADAAAADPALRARLRAAADASPSHRRIFVHGLASSADDAALSDAFSRCGPLAACHAVVHRASGRCKGYGFVTLASRAAARRALRHAAGVGVAGRPVSAQFASAGPSRGAGWRRVYVTGVAPDAACAGRLRAFFARFGELEGGPFGFDAETGRSRGYALFVYRAASGAAKAVEEPCRVFEGRALRCRLADKPARRNKAVAGSASVTPPAPAALRSVLDAITAAGVGDLAACARNPAQAMALLGQNPILAAAALHSALASAAAARRPSPIAPNPAVTSSPMAAAELRPATVAAAAAAPSPVKVGVGPNGGVGLLGPYKPPSASGKKGTKVGLGT